MGQMLRHCFDPVVVVVVVCGGGGGAVLLLLVCFESRCSRGREANGEEIKIVIIEERSRVLQSQLM